MSESDDPFKHLPPLFGDMMRMMRQQSADVSGQAKAFAVQVATDGTPETNVDPLTRMKVEQLARVAELRVADATGLLVNGQLTPCTKSHWAVTTLDHYKPLFDHLGQGLAEASAESDPDAALDEFGEPDPMAWLAPLMAAMQPMMLALTTGSMVGHLAVRGFGSYDLPVPRPPGGDVMLIVDNATAFASDWSIPDDDLLLWLCLHQLTHHAVLSVPHVRQRLESLLQQYVGSFGSASGSLDELLSGFDLSDPTALQRQFGNTDLLLGMLESDAQREIKPQLHAVVAAIEGFVDVIMDHVGGQLISSYDQTTEALRRRRVEADDASRSVERMLGFDLSQEQFDRGTKFAEGVVERESIESLAKMWRSEADLPTPAEIDAPGLWLARIEFNDPPTG